MRRALALALSAGLLACAAPEDSPDLAAPAAEASAEPTAAGDGALAREVARLLPLERDLVWWYRAVLPATGETGEVVLFAARDQRLGPYLESIGLPRDDRGPGLRLWRSRSAVWVFPGATVGGAAYRAWSGVQRWDGGAGRSLGVQHVSVPVDAFRAAATEHRLGEDRLARHWFAPEVGLVRLEVREVGVLVLELELLGTTPRGRPAEGYDTSSPEAAWRSIEQAAARLDVASLDSLLGPRLRERTRRPGWDAVLDLEPPAALRRGPTDPHALRIRFEIGQLLALDVTPTGPWAVEGREARAAAELSRQEEGAPGRARATIVMRQLDSGAWRWEDLRLE